MTKTKTNTKPEIKINNSLNTKTKQNNMFEQDTWIKHSRRLRPRPTFYQERELYQDQHCPQDKDKLQGMINASNTAKIEYSFRINFGETQNNSEIDHRWGENFQDAKWQM